MPTPNFPKRTIRQVLQQVYVKNPPLDDLSNYPVNEGETRMVDGNLEWLHSVTNTWVPALRLPEIRAWYIEQSFNGQEYDFEKRHGNKHGKGPDNYTSFNLRDKPYGPLREYRDPILFQIRPDRTPGLKPTNFVKVNGCVVLDAFDHGIRDFGNAIPLCLSSEVQGHDIETYMRRNSEIAYYDLIARCPRGYWFGKTGQYWHKDPPRAGTLSFRATRFRLQAGLLAWAEKGDTFAKNRHLLSLMPPICHETNSAIHFRDLTKAEIEKAQPAKGHRFNKARKTRRAQRAAELREAQGITDDEDSDDDDDEELAAQLFAPVEPPGKSGTRKRRSSARSDDSDYEPECKREAISSGDDQSDDDLRSSGRLRSLAPKPRVALGLGLGENPARVLQSSSLSSISTVTTPISEVSPDHADAIAGRELSEDIGNAVAPGDDAHGNTNAPRDVSIDFGNAVASRNFTSDKCDTVEPRDIPIDFGNAVSPDSLASDDSDTVAPHEISLNFGNTSVTVDHGNTISLREIESNLEDAVAPISAKPSRRYRAIAPKPPAVPKVLHRKRKALRPRGRRAPILDKIAAVGLGPKNSRIIRPSLLANPNNVTLPYVAGPNDIDPQQTGRRAPILDNIPAAGLGPYDSRMIQPSSPANTNNATLPQIAGFNANGISSTRQPPAPMLDNIAAAGLQPYGSRMKWANSDNTILSQASGFHAFDPNPSRQSRVPTYDNIASAGLEPHGSRMTLPPLSPAYADNAKLPRVSELNAMNFNPTLRSQTPMLDKISTLEPYSNRRILPSMSPANANDVALPHIAGSTVNNVHNAIRAENAANANNAPMIPATGQYPMNTPVSPMPQANRIHASYPPIVALNPQDDRVFRAQELDGLRRGDFRYFNPTGPGCGSFDIYHIYQALQATRNDFRMKVGYGPPQWMEDTYKGESYASQYWRLNHEFQQRINFNRSMSKLFHLGGWKQGFKYWFKVMPSADQMPPLYSN